MVREAVKATGEFAEPIWKAYELEGSKNFNAPRQVGGPLANTCHKGGCADGSPWTISAQVLAYAASIKTKDPLPAPTLCCWIVHMGGIKTSTEIYKKNYSLIKSNRGKI